MKKSISLTLMSDDLYFASFMSIFKTMCKTIM